MPNRLAIEKSPYLLQHAHNPVNWYPWGDEAFARAAEGNIPIFLSVGYSTCHWCHVMEHESFENAGVAAILNEHFVAIKVDREERPDVDRVYMAFVQATTGSGGWPMSVWLTPDRKPFYGGTYYPPESRWGRPGFAEILKEIARAWRDNGDGVRRSAETLTARLTDIGRSDRGGRVPGPEALTRTVQEFASTFDARRGGFGQAPKFPRPSELLFLLRESARTGEPEGRDMAAQTLRAMALGGMRDHVGGGFHRYSVDADWRVPHFEKMLYDQAQLVLAYLDASQATGDAMFAQVADHTLSYVARDLTAPGGGFFSAEDADSVPPTRADEPDARKAEGAFYLWAHDEIERVVGADADLVRARFGIERDGNAPSDPHNEFGTGNLLYAARSPAELAVEFGLAEDEVTARIERARQKMDAARAPRPRPHLDDKILTAWNGLMIGACARAARVLGRSSHLDAARRAAAFLRVHLWDEATGTLWRRYRDGESAIEGYADDYANTIFGLLELFQADGDVESLEWAITLQRRQDELFWDERDGGWFSTTGSDPSVLLRMKEDYDGAEPAASSISAGNLLVLAHLTGEAAWQVRVEQTLRACAGRLATAGRAMPQMMAVLSAYHAGVQQLVVVGPHVSPVTRALVDAGRRTFLPFAVQVTVEPGPLQQRLATLCPPLGAMTMKDGKPTAYWCRDFVCQEPVTEPEVLTAALVRP